MRDLLVITVFLAHQILQIFPMLLKQLSKVPFQLCVCSLRLDDDREVGIGSLFRIVEYS